MLHIDDAVREFSIWRTGCSQFFIQTQYDDGGQMDILIPLTAQTLFAGTITKASLRSGEKKNINYNKHIFIIQLI